MSKLMDNNVIMTLTYVEGVKNPLLRTQFLEHGEYLNSHFAHLCTQNITHLVCHLH